MQLSSRVEKICANLFLLMLTIFFMLVIGEVLLKCFLFHPSYNLVASQVLNGHGSELKVELIPDNLYEIQPNKKLGINKYGFRDDDFSTQRNSRKRIIFLGDSYVMGLNVKSEETMPKALEKLLKNYEVYNMGVVGFGPDQELNVLNKYGFQFKPDLVIQAICSINDSGDIYEDQIFTTGDHDELVVTDTNPVKSMVYPSFFTTVNAINFLRHRDKIVRTLDPLLFGDGFDLSWIKYMDSDEAKYKISLMKAIFLKMRDDIKARNINFISIIIPSYNAICDDAFFKENHISQEKYFTNEEVYQYILDTEKIPNINLAPYFMQLNKEDRCALYDAQNAHLSPLGNLFAAQIISIYMASHGLTGK